MHFFPAAVSCLRPLVTNKLLPRATSRANAASRKKRDSVSVLRPLCSRRGFSARTRTDGMGNMYEHSADAGVSSTAGGETGYNAWVGGNGPGSLDLRSDVMTVPTPSMLAAISRCSLGDDVFNEDPTTMDLEAHVAKLTGKEAGVFVLSGTMGNQIALRCLLTQAPHSVMTDHRSHIYCYEAGGLSSLAGAMVHAIKPANGTHLTLEDVKANAILTEDVHAATTRVISLENTLNGMILPLEEARRISEFARQHDIKVHCDGARLWEAVAAGAGTLPEYCALFDTISLCFSKGLGAPVGSIIVGTKKTVDHARRIRKMMGGGTRQPGVLTAAARVAVDETFGKSPDGSQGLLRGTHAFAKKVETLWKGMGGKLVHPVHTNIVWLDTDAANCSLERFFEINKEEGLKVMGNRLVTHYQIAQNGEEVYARLERVFTKVMAESK